MTLTQVSVVVDLARTVFDWFRPFGWIYWPRIDRVVVDVVIGISERRLRLISQVLFDAGHFVPGSEPSDQVERLHGFGSRALVCFIGQQTVILSQCRRSVVRTQVQVSLPTA